VRQILTFGETLGSELWLVLCLMPTLIFLILNMLKYMEVYEGIWGLSGVYEGI